MHNYTVGEKKKSHSQYKHSLQKSNYTLKKETKGVKSPVVCRGYRSCCPSVWGFACMSVYVRVLTKCGTSPHLTF